MFITRDKLFKRIPILEWFLGVKPILCHLSLSIIAYKTLLATIMFLFLYVLYIILLNLSNEQYGLIRVLTNQNCCSAEQLAIEKQENRVKHREFMENKRLLLTMT